MTQPHTDQLGFDALLQDAEADNKAREFAGKTAHLPGTMTEALRYYKTLLRAHHAAMFAADAKEAMRLREDARLLAVKLNGGQRGILANDEAPGCVLASKTAAPENVVPLWGQEGDFILDCDGMLVRIALDGIFGIGAGCMFWPGFSAHAVEPDKPFLSETGYRSFLGIAAEAEAELLPDEFVYKVIKAYIERDCKGQRVMIAERYQPRAA